MRYGSYTFFLAFYMLYAFHNRCQMYHIASDNNLLQMSRSSNSISKYTCISTDTVQLIQGYKAEFKPFLLFILTSYRLLLFLLYFMTDLELL